MAAQDQVGVSVADFEVLGRQVAEAFGGRAEQQGDSAGSPDFRGQGIVGQAALKERPSVVLVEQVLGLLPGDGGEGQFAGEPAAGMKYDYRDAPPHLLARARTIADVCAAHGTTLPAAAIAFPRTHPSIINVTLGMRTPEQVGRNVELHEQCVPDGLWDDLRTQGLIRSDALTAHGEGDERCL